MKYNYLELEKVQKLVSLQKEIYQPGPFWKSAAKEIVNAVEEHGIENFRRLGVALGFFVPTYGVPANSFSVEAKAAISDFLAETGTAKQILAMEEFLSGYFHALSDYRVFIGSDDKKIPPRLDDFSESDYGNPIERFCFDDKFYSRSSLNYLLGICFLKKHIDGSANIKTVLEIGGGFGSLGEIFKSAGGMKYINVDIPPTSFIAHAYLSKIYPADDIEPYLQDRDTELDISGLKSCSVFNSWDIELLCGEIDLFVNFISFQEMEPDIVKNYLQHVERLKPKYVLLRNMREGKQLKVSPEGLGVETPILTNDYISMVEVNYALVATSIFPFGYKTVDGFHSELLLFRRKG